MHRFSKETLIDIEKMHKFLYNLAMKMYQEIDDKDEVIINSTTLAKQTLKLSTEYESYVKLYKKEKDNELLLKNIEEFLKINMLYKGKTLIQYNELKNIMINYLSNT